MTITIFHNPDCDTSRNVLALIRSSGKEPLVTEYLKTPPSRADLVSLINRPIVVTPDAGRLCRPSEAVLDILPNPQRAAFSKENGAAIVDHDGKCMASPAP